jgi:hypothetical protein
MFTTDEWVQLVSATRERTDSGDLVWKPAKADATYQAHLNKETIALLRSVDGDGQPPYELAIFRPNPEPDTANKWKRFDSTETQEMMDAGSWGVDLLALLYQSITRKANEVDVIFKSIMDTLRPGE